ncbi:MAG TPA: hypothetical protein VEV83_03535 [Parafilimonas sp.]|nr:hypothetical protein [Parafilimonas sp.]
MKILAFLFTILIAHNLEAQKSIFIRVYDLEGHKIARGHVLSATDTSLQLKEKTTSILVRNIGSIRTKHSAGNNMLVGSIIGTTTFAVLGAINGDTDTPAEGAAYWAPVGTLLGAVFGALTIPFKNSKHSLINGDPEKWKAFRSKIP